MLMSRLGLLSGTAALGLFFGAAAVQAADMPVYYEQPAFGGWYLRGDIGMSNQKVDDLWNAYYEGEDYSILEKDFDPSWFIGLGIGYQFNEWLRADITGEYRAKSDFSGLDYIEGTPDVSNDFDSEKEEWTFLANVYWDIGTWHRITPFIGAGVGASYNKIGFLTDSNVLDPQSGPACPTNGCADSNGEWQFAWALHAGLAFALAPNMTIELAYRFLALGDAKSGDIYDLNGVSNDVNPLEFEDLYSHDIKLGFRYSFN
jgi:opacity protein-like surface antigen